MKNKIFSFFIIAVILCPQLHASATLEKTEKIQKTLKFANPVEAKEIEIDNINGSIKLVGYKGDNIEVVINKTITAKSEIKLKEANEEIKLEITENDNFVSLFVDAPYRKNDGSVNYKGWRHYGYEVIFDFEVKVPYKTDFCLKTVNEGNIVVENIDGDYDVKNINGGITMKNVAGSGKAYALNEPLVVTFRKNPETNCYFGSLNGDVDITFIEGLSADFHIKTFNGDAYTDFPVTYIPVAKQVSKSRNGKFVYKSNQLTGVRVGEGGPEIVVDAFNGDIHIYEKN